MNKVLHNIRRALHVTGYEDDRRKAVRARLAAHPRNLVPERATQGHNDLVGLFAEQLIAVEATITEVVNPADVPDEIVRYLGAHNLPMQIRRGADPRFEALDWSRQSGLVVKSGPADPNDEVSLTYALAGAGETGTLFVPSGPENPVSLSFLPETNIALVERHRIVGSYEEAWQILRERVGEGGMPRTVNLISGPSRTADIEQTLITGAHGPRRLHVIVVG